MITTLSTQFLSTNVYAKDTAETKVIINEGATNVPDKIIQELLAENPNAGVITIYEYSEIGQDEITGSKFSGSKFLDNEPIVPYGLPHFNYGPVYTTFSNQSYNVLLDDQFKFSAAKGETVTLQYDIEASLTGSISGSILDAVKIGAEVTVKGKFSRGTTYKGPEESSYYNTREFRIKFYGETGTYTQTQKVTITQAGMPTRIENKSAQGSYVKPTRFLSYSVDTYVWP